MTETKASQTLPGVDPAVSTPARRHDDGLHGGHDSCPAPGESADRAAGRLR